MLLQSLRKLQPHDGEPHALTAGIGLLPCPLTISVLGFAWIQTNGAMVAVVLIALAMGIATTIGSVALISILGRRMMGAALAGYLPRLERSARILQGAAGAAIALIGLATLFKALR